MDDLRKQIDHIDCELMKLIEKRFKLTKEVGLRKQQSNQKVTNSNREQEVLAKAKEFVYEDEITEIYKLMFKQNKFYQSFDFGLIGKSLPYTLSPVVYQKLGLDNYQIIETNDFLKTLKKINYKGINITIPYKTQAYEVVENLDHSAKKTKTVNMIIDNTGYNTDYLGLMNLFKKWGLDFSNKKVVIIGNGATARSVSHALGVEPIYLVRTIRNHNEVLISDYLKVSDCDYLINTTPYGTFPNLEDQPMFPLNDFKKLQMIVDVVYNPINTPLIIEAKKHNITYKNGLTLLVEQACISYNLFTNIQQNSLDIYHQLLKSLHNIVLIGLSYSGKSTLAIELSEYLDKTLVDTDKELEKQNMDLNSLNKVSLFREYETQMAIKYGSCNNQVIATGGGVVLSEKAMAALAKNGVFVFIDVELDELVKRIDQTRPLIKNPEDFERMYNERIDLYRKYSDVTINNQMSIKEIAEKIYEYLCY